MRTYEHLPSFSIHVLFFSSHLPLPFISFTISPRISLYLNLISPPSPFASSISPHIPSPPLSHFISPLSPHLSSLLLSPYSLSHLISLTFHPPLLSLLLQLLDEAERARAERVEQLRLHKLNQLAQWKKERELELKEENGEGREGGKCSRK